MSDNKWGFWFNIYTYIHKIKEIKSLVLGDHEKVYLICHYFIKVYIHGSPSLFNMSLFSKLNCRYEVD